MRALVGGVRVQALALEQSVAVLEVEQGARGDRDNQGVGIGWHGASILLAGIAR
jgi:hypothetical protein